MSQRKIDQQQRIPDSLADNATRLSEVGYFNYINSSGIKQPRGGEGAPGSGKRSIFNDYHVLSLNKGNYPLFDTEYSKIRESIDAKSAIDLISNPQGASIYTPKDFMLAARYGMPINRMITLRRFPYPSVDNIHDSSAQTEPDISRMVTYFDETINPLSDILKMSWGLNWSELVAATEQAGTMIGDSQSGVNGWMGSFAKILDQGQSALNDVRKHEIQVDPLQDSNKIHGPVDVIHKTKIRDIGLNNEMDISITFDYEMKSINGMNPKALFIDCISNILATTYNNGRFWGGARYWVGKQPSDWMQKFKWMNAKDANDFMEKGTIALKGFLSDFGSDPGAKALDILRTVIRNGMNLALGKVLDIVGRPGIAVMNSLLNNDPVGEWHLTVGNPLNPILSMGNLVINSTEIQFGDELGYDDFPTNFTVTVTLSQGMPRDKAGIESVFNKGMGRTYWAPTSILKNSTNFGSYGNSAVKTAHDQAFEFVKDPTTGSSGISISSGGGQIKTPPPTNISYPTPDGKWNNIPIETKKTIEF